MIPDKLYIPTTTLNFNNIMASESISPAGFYSIRGFGYNRFDKVKPNNLDKRIILYDKYPIFDIDDMESENYPLVIEVTLKHMDKEIIHKHKNGIFYTEKTIYLNPFSTKIYFRSEDEKRHILSKVEQSSSTKMIPIYQNCILIQTPNVNSFKWEESDIADSDIDVSKYISKDRRVNKLKGLLYAYLLGANRSLVLEVTMLKKHTKELQNILSAIIADPDGYATPKQKEELEKLYREIDSTFLQIYSTILQDRIKQKEAKYNSQNVGEFLKGEGLYDAWCQEQNLEPVYKISPFDLSAYKISNKKDREYDNNKTEESKEYFFAYFSKLESAIDKHIKSVNTDVDNLPILQHCNKVERIPTEKKDFLVKLFNEYCQERWNKDSFQNSRLEFATTGGRLFKEELELRDQWENSPSKSYINDLRNNLASHATFDLNSVSNITLQSFAAFCQKGEEDIDKLEDYLVSNKIGDFHVAFALWGIIFGFANMPKTLTDGLFRDNKDYMCEVYRSIYEQVHGISLQEQLESFQQKESTTQVEENSTVEESSIDSLEQELLEFKDFISMEGDVREEVIKKFKEVGIYSLVDNWDIQKANSIKWKKIKGQKRLIGAIEQKKNNNKKPSQKSMVSNNKKTKQIATSDSPSLFDQPQVPVREYFHKDKNIFESLRYLLPDDEKVKKQFEEDLDWFQGNYREHFEDKKKRIQKGVYYKLPTDNKSVINHFQKYLKDKKEPKSEQQNWLREKYSLVNVESIIAKLKELFLLNE